MPLSPDRIFATGIALVRGQGWGALSLRAVAGRLGVTPMALYRHVTDGPALQRSVLRAIAGELASVPRSDDPGEDLVAWATRARRVLHAHPGVGMPMLARWSEIPETLGMVDDLLATVHRAGMVEFDAAAAVNTLLTFVLARGDAECSIRDDGAVRRAVADGGAGRPLPDLAVLAAHFEAPALDRQFEYGLNALLVGVGVVASATSLP